MKNNGFTLIELLATITVLSIILLITFASIGSVIRNSKKSLHDSQITQVERAAEYYNNKEGLKDYDICINVSDLVEKGYIKQDEVIDPKGEEELDGSVIISYNGKKYSYEYQEKVCYYTYIKLLEDAAPTGLSEGDKYEYQVNDTDTFKFYVLSIEDNTVNLIMDRNICGYLDSANTDNGKEATEERPCLIAWYDDGDNPVNYDNDTNEFGPVTAMEGLYNATKNWTNVPDMNLEYSDEGHIANSSYGYGKIETTATGIKITKKDGTTEVTRSGNLTPVIPYETNKPLKARLPKLEEVYNTDTNDTTHCHNSSGSCPVWLTNGLEEYSSYYTNNDHISGISGYWTLSSNLDNSVRARCVDYIGYGNDSSDTSNASYSGLRAVITVPMSTFINK